MAFKWYGILLNLALVALVFGGAAVYKYHFRSSERKSPVLMIRDSDSGKLYGKWPLENAEFSIEFIHSVNQSPVREKFRVQDKKIMPQETLFYSFGAGMQSDIEPGQIMSRDGDALIISGFDTAYTELNYIVGTVSDHILSIEGRLPMAISLRELCGQNAHITLYIK